MPRQKPSHRRVWVKVPAPSTARGAPYHWIPAFAGMTAGALSALCIVGGATFYS